MTSVKSATTSPLGVQSKSKVTKKTGPLTVSEITALLPAPKKTPSDSSSSSTAGEVEEGSEEAPASFESLGVGPVLCGACKSVGFEHPTPIQVAAIPHAIAGKDVIGLAQTGSGKTAAFAIPVLQRLLTAAETTGTGKAPTGYALVIAPTRELAFQIAQVFSGLGASMGVTVATLVGGVDMMAQAMNLGKRPHIIVGTPGRIVDHLENTRGFSLHALKVLVLDEADRLLALEFGEEIDKVLRVAPRERTTMLFSATMTTKVAKLQRASLKAPVKVEVSSKYSTVDSLLQQYMFVPTKHKDAYLVHLLNDTQGSSIIVFASSCNSVLKLTLMLRALGFSAIPLHGQMSQPKRLGALHKFTAGSRSILIATDVASRGLDIPSVDVVVNYDIPVHSKDYIHRVGRTARAGRSGRSLTMVTQYDVEIFQRIEAMLGRKLPAYEVPREEVLLLAERVMEAQRVASMDLKERDVGGGNGKKNKRLPGVRPKKKTRTGRKASGRKN